MEMPCGLFLKSRAKARDPYRCKSASIEYFRLEILSGVGSLTRDLAGSGLQKQNLHARLSSTAFSVGGAGLGGTRRS